MSAKRLRQMLESASIPILATILGLAASSLIVLFAHADPIQTYQHLFCEGFGPKGCQSFGDLLVMNAKTDSGTQTVFSPLYGAGGHALGVVLERATVMILA